MFKSEALFVLTILVIGLAVIASSCAPATTPPAAITPPSSAPTPPAITTSPAAPAAPTVTPTWGDSKTYTNDALEFTVTYPAKWITKDIDDAIGGEVQKVAADAYLTSDSAYVYVVPAVTDMGAVVVAGLDNNPSFRLYNAMAKLDSVKPCTLTCGTVTDATAVECSAKIGTHNFYFYVIGVTKGDKTVMALGDTTGDANARKQIQEICQSLCFK